MSMAFHVRQNEMERRLDLLARELDELRAKVIELEAKAQPAPPPQRPVLHARNA